MGKAWDPTRCRRRSRPATRGHVVPRTPNGRASRRSTRRSRVRQPSPVVELNRAVALSMAFGPAVGLEIVDRLMEEPALKQYHWLPSGARTCCPSSAAMPRPKRNSNAPPR